MSAVACDKAAIGAMHTEKVEAWKNRLNKSGKKDEFERIMSGTLPKKWEDPLLEFKRKHTEEKTKMASRKASQEQSQGLLQPSAIVLPISQHMPEGRRTVRSGRTG